MFLPGRSEYGIRPISVGDSARLAVDAAAGDDNVEMDAAGSEVFTNAGMVPRMRDKTGFRCLVTPLPKILTHLAGRVLVHVMNDIVQTRDEIERSSRGLLVSRPGQPAPAYGSSSGSTKTPTVWETATPARWQRDTVSPGVQHNPLERQDAWDSR